MTLHSVHSLHWLRGYECLSG